ncbi:hypothetical protein F4861DRAFT_204292 [Xylaria intraflava]|nr:hypothetical protein F4861DRAFT_204292 [Xylaria intraflava]
MGWLSRSCLGVSVVWIPPPGQSKNTHPPMRWRRKTYGSIPFDRSTLNRRPSASAGLSSQNADLVRIRTTVVYCIIELPNRLEEPSSRPPKHVLFGYRSLERRAARRRLWTVVAGLESERREGEASKLRGKDWFEPLDEDGHMPR